MPQEPLETHEPQEAATDPQETQEATLDQQMIPLPLEPQEPLATRSSTGTSCDYNTTGESRASGNPRSTRS